MRTHLCRAFAVLCAGAWLSASPLRAAPAPTVQDFGALGNSSGATGSGHDDTAAIVAALATGNAYLPCGTYRITQIVIQDNGRYHLHGNGACSRIFLDAPASAAIVFAAPTICTACIHIDGLDFIKPSHASSAVGIVLENETQAVIIDNAGEGWTDFIWLTTAYAPTIQRNTLTGIGTLLGTNGGGDLSLNNAKIINNHIYDSGAALSLYAISLNCSGAYNLTIRENDLEGNYGGVLLNSCNAVDLSGNYIENNSAGNVAFVGANAGYSMTANWFGQAASSQFTGVQKLRLGGNAFYNWRVSWGVGVSGVIIDPTNMMLGTGALAPAP